MSKLSENSYKLLTYLQENAGSKMTVNEVAENTGIPKATITGAFTSFVRKGLGVREDAHIPGTVEVSLLKLTEAGKTADTSEMSDTAKAIVAYFVETNNSPLTLDDLSVAVDIDKKKVNGAFNGLVRKELAVRKVAEIEASVPVKFLVLTQEGLDYDPTLDDTEDAED